MPSCLSKLPIIDSTDRVNTGNANPVNMAKLIPQANMVEFSRHFKSKAFLDLLRAGNTEPVTPEINAILEAVDKYSPEELSKGVAGDNIKVLRGINPIDGYSSTHEQVACKGVCKSPLSQPNDLFHLSLHIAEQLIKAARATVPVGQEMTENPEEVESIEPNIRCPHGHANHASGGCYCRTDSSEAIDGLSGQELEDFNGLSIEGQKSMLRSLQVPFREPSGRPEEPPLIFLQWIPMKKELETETYPIPLAWRMIFVIPPSSTINFGRVVQEMICEHSSKKRKNIRTISNQYTKYAYHLNSRESFLHLLGQVMWGMKEQYTNRMVNKEHPDICSSDENFVKGVNDILCLKKDTMAVVASLSAVDRKNKSFKDILHKNTADYAWDLQHLFRQDEEGTELFSPSLKSQQWMVHLTSDLLMKKNGISPYVKKYNHWHQKEHLEYFRKRYNVETSAEQEKPIRSSFGAPTNGILRNPQTHNSELASLSQQDLYQHEDPEIANRLKQSTKQWYDGQEGAGLNIMRAQQRVNLQILEQKFSKTTSNAERRKLRDEHIEDSCALLKRFSKRSDLFSSTKGAFRHMEVLAHRSEDHGNIGTAWNPLIMGFNKDISPALGIGDMFVAELFHVAESLFYVSTHTGILYFCFVCTADGWCTRLNKNHWIFCGAPDGGKSYTSNQCKDLMLIPASILMKTKQSSAALDDLDVMDFRELMEEADMELWDKNPKHARKQDEEKNRLTSGQSTAVKKQQFKDPYDEIVRWKTMQIITIQNRQIGCSTNETELSSKCNLAMLSRIPKKEINIMKRTKGRRGVSEMNSAKAQAGVEKKRRTDQYAAKYQYYDALRFLIYKAINLGILVNPEKVIFDLTLDKLKKYLKEKGVSIASRTEDRIYGKAVSIMMIRIIATLFEFPKEESKLIIGAIPFDSDVDSWKVMDKEFLKNLRVHDDDLQTILDNLHLKDHFENIRFVDKHNQIKKTLFVNVGKEKAFDGNKPVLNLRTLQVSRRGAINLDLPENALGAFYKQWVSIGHNNFTEFIKKVSPMLVIAQEDCCKAIYHSRSEFAPDKTVLFEKNILRLGINILQSDALRKAKDDKKKRNMFRRYKVNVGDNSEFSTDYGYIDAGTLDNIVSSSQNQKNLKEPSSAYPEGFEVYLDRKTMRELLINMSKRQCSLGYVPISAGRITDGTNNKEPEFFGGMLKLKEGVLPEKFDQIGPTGFTSSWGDAPVPQTFSRKTLAEKEDLGKAMYARRQREHPNGARRETRKTVVVQNRPRKILQISTTNDKITGSSKVFINTCWIEENFHKRNTPLEEMGLIEFFSTLGFKHDGIKISKETSERLIAEKKQEFVDAKHPEDKKAFYKKQLDYDVARIKGLVAKEGEPIGKLVLLAEPFLGHGMDNKGNKKLRCCQPPISHSVTIPHSEEELSTESANIPSSHAGNILKLSKADTKRTFTKIQMPLDALAFMMHLSQLCYLPDGATEKNFLALYNYNYQCNGRWLYPYRFACPREMRRMVHAGLKPSDYEFPAFYPHTAAWSEELQYNCRRVETADGTVKWVPYNAEMETQAVNQSLPKGILDQLQQLFGHVPSPIAQPEAVGLEEEARDAVERSLEQRTEEIVIIDDETHDSDVDESPEKRPRHNSTERVWTDADIQNVIQNSSMDHSGWDDNELERTRRQISAANERVHDADRDPMQSLFGEQDGDDEGQSWEELDLQATIADAEAEKRRREVQSSLIMQVEEGGDDY